MQIRFHRMQREYASVFRIANMTRTHLEVLVLELDDAECIGRGEAAGIFYHGETVDTMLQQLTRVESDLRSGVTRADLQTLLPPGGARNAVDCALWDLEAKRCGRRVWELAGIETVRPLVTAYTLGLDTPEAMAGAAAAAGRYCVLKLKLGGNGDVERVRRVREARPDAQLIVDANQAWNEGQLHEFLPKLAKLGVTLIEQPLPAGKDEVLAGFSSAVPLCADESCQTTQSLPSIINKYDFVNIKLDKTGGLTEALQLARVARREGLRLMAGCMGGSSLGMAPAFVIGQLCEVVDLDSPLLTKADVPHAIHYEGSRMSVPESSLWG